VTGPPRTKRDYLRQLVLEKNRWSRPLTAEEKASGFMGWHERGYLPHCDFPDLIQFVTFRLRDSLPRSRRGEWEHLLKIESVRERRLKLENYLDRGLGHCLLRDAKTAKLVQDALLNFHPDRYELHAWCVMPNHVHVLLDVKRMPLWKVVQNWKVHSESEQRRLRLMERREPPRPGSKTGNNTPGRCPALPLQWQREYWDTFMRDEEQNRKAIRYIETNPVKANLCRSAEDWPFSSARFRDRYARLVL
jgi:type I restriction enzyme R subunit/putative DNA methylase